MTNNITPQEAMELKQAIEINAGRAVMPDSLTINGVVYVRAGVEPDDCAKQTCSYFNHYLIYYRADYQGERLEHAAYHIAEKRCEEAQEKLSQWWDAHPNGGTEPPNLSRQCDFWEKKVAA